MVLFAASRGSNAPFPGEMRKQQLKLSLGRYLETLSCESTPDLPRSILQRRCAEVRMKALLDAVEQAFRHMGSVGFDVGSTNYWRACQ